VLGGGCAVLMSKNSNVAASFLSMLVSMIPIGLGVYICSNTEKMMQPAAARRRNSPKPIRSVFNSRAMVAIGVLLLLCGAKLNISLSMALTNGTHQGSFILLKIVLGLVLGCALYYFGNKKWQEAKEAETKSLPGEVLMFIGAIVILFTGNIIGIVGMELALNGINSLAQAKAKAALSAESSFTGVPPDTDV
jgi:hypothetical protein